MSSLNILTDEAGKLIFTKFGKTLVSTKLETKLARRVRECAFICTELEDSIYWLERLVTLIDSHPNDATERTQENEIFAKEARAYFTSACMTYYKFFTHGHGMSVKADANKLYSQDQLATHALVEELRHKFMAHIDHSDNLSGDIYSLEDPEHRLSPSIIPVFKRTNHFLDYKLEDFLALVKFLYTHFDKQYEQSSRVLMESVFGSK